MFNCNLMDSCLIFKNNFSVFNTINHSLFLNPPSLCGLQQEHILWLILLGLQLLPLALTHNLWGSWSLVIVLISNYSNFLDDLIQFQGLNTTSIPLIPEFIFPAQISFLNSRLIKLHAYSANNKHLKFNTSKLELLLHLQPTHLAIIPSNLSGQRPHSYFCLIFCILAHMQDQQESLLVSPPKYIQS